MSQQSPYQRDVCRRNIFQLAQLTLSLGRLFGQDVIPEGLSVLITFSRFLKTFGCTTTSFQFWHFHDSALFILIGAQIPKGIAPVSLGAQARLSFASRIFPVYLRGILLRVGGQNHGQLPAFHFWKHLNCANFGKILFYPLE